MADESLDNCVDFSDTESSDYVEPTAQLYGQPVASSLCHLGWRPLLITGFVINILQRHFSVESNIQEPFLRTGPSGGKSLVWTPDVKTTGIYIESVNRWDVSGVEFRPAVLVKRNACRNARYTVAGRSAPTQEGFDQYSIKVTGSHTVFCIGRQPAAVELLAGEVDRFLLQAAPIIGQRLGLSKFMSLEMGDVGTVEESTQNYVVPIVVGWEYISTWVVQEASMPFMDYHSHDLGGSVTIPGSLVNLTR